MDIAKRIRNRDRASLLNESWNVGAVQARFRETGDWYASLSKFPAALFDARGYLLFESEDSYRSSPHIRIRKQISVPQPGISAVPGYVLVVTAGPLNETDLDLHELEAAEGTALLVSHLLRERNKSLVRAKKKRATSVACEACGFSFAMAYGEAAIDYCEVHHLVPLSDAKDGAKTKLEDLAILCANCHRVVHLRNPPYSLVELKSMLSVAHAKA